MITESVGSNETDMLQCKEVGISLGSGASPGWWLLYAEAAHV